jgi:hypothetical protein
LPVEQSSIANVEQRISNAALTGSSKAQMTGRSELTLTPAPKKAEEKGRLEDKQIYKLVSESGGALEINSAVETSSGPSVESRRTNRTARTSIGTAVLQNRGSIELVSLSFSSFIEDKLSTLRQAPPNSAEARAVRAQEIAEYEELKRRFEAFLAATAEFSADADQEKAVVETTTSFSEGLSYWWTKRHVQICEKSFGLGLFTLGAAVCSLAGASGVLAAIVPGVLVGGKSVVDALKAWSKANQK